MSRFGQSVSYVTVLRTKGAGRPFAAATLARLSYGTVSLALLLTIQSATGSLGSAGVALGIYGVLSLTMPFKSRAIDRFGPRRILAPLALAYSGSLFLMVGLVLNGVSATSPYARLSGAAGVLAPPVGPVMRQLWSKLCPSLIHRQKAYALDASSEETVFVSGPLIVGVLTAVSRPVVALALSAVLALVGVLQLARVAPWTPAPFPNVQSGRNFLGPLEIPEMRWMLLVVLAVGATWSSLEVGVVAMTEEAGRAATSGYLLAVLSLGSVAGGLLWGRCQHHRDYTTQLLGLMVMLAGAIVLASAMKSTATLAIVLMMVGASVAQIFIVAYLAADQLTAAGMRTEATTWVAVANNLGVAVGASTVGHLIHATTAHLALLLAGFGLAATAGALGAQRILARRPALPVGGRKDEVI